MQEYYDYIYLLACGANGKKPEVEEIQNMKLDKIYGIACSHTLTALTFYALESSGYVPVDVNDKKVFDKWKQSRDMAITKNILLDEERKNLFEYMDEHKIWHVPLKGVILKDMYPSVGMRQMADNDILFDDKYRELVHDWFMERNYECEAYNVTNHDVYIKEPIYNFEMHVELCGDRLEEVHDYYKNVKDKFKKDKYLYSFDDNDFYVYIVVHAYKHYSNRGTGIRTLLDLYIYNKVKKDKLDYKYIEEELSKMGIEQFEKESRILAKLVFGGERKSLTSKQMEMLQNYLCCGTYGSDEMLLYNGLNRINPNEKKHSFKTKMIYLFQYAFPTKDYMMNIWCVKRFPLASKFAILLPLAYVYRLINRGIVKFHKWTKILRDIRKI